MRNKLKRIISIFLVFSLLFPILSFGEGVEQTDVIDKDINVEDNIELTDEVLQEPNEEDTQLLNIDNKSDEKEEGILEENSEDIEKIQELKELESIEIKKPQISINQTEENQEVIVTITSENDTHIEYKLEENEDWIEYKEPFKVFKNTIVYAKTIDDEGNLSEIAEYEIKDITKKEISEFENLKDSSLRERIEEIILDTIDFALEYHYSMDWVAVGLAKTGNKDKIPKDYLPTVTKEIKDLALQEENGEYVQPTDYERRILGLLAIGGDPRNVDGIDAIERIYNSQYMDRQGINAKIFGLIALDSGNYNTSKNAEWDRDRLIKDILKLECTNEENSYGKKAGWTFGGTNADVDMTGMALTALAPYYDQRDDVKVAVDRAVEWLSEVQLDDGGFASWGSLNSESCAQVIMGLCANNINPTGDKFTKTDGNVVESLLSFFNEDADEPGFAHIKENGFVPNGMANEQALYALAQYLQYLDGKGSIYRWGDKDYATDVPQVEIKFGEETNITSNIMTFENDIVLDFSNAKYNSNSTITIFDVTDKLSSKTNNIFKLYGKIIEIKLSNVDEKDEIIIEMPTNNRASAIYFFYKDIDSFEYLYTNHRNGKLISNLYNYDGSIILGVLGENNAPSNVSFDYEVKKNKVLFYNLYGEDESGIQYFEIYKDGNKYTKARKDEYLTPPLEWDKEYQFKIRAVDNLGNVSDFTEEALIKTPKNPNGNPDSVNVSIRIEGYNGNVIEMQNIEVDVFDLEPYLGKATGSSAKPSTGWGKEKFDTPTAAHATVKILNEYDVSYDLQDYGWALYMAMIDGDREFDHRSTSGWMYRVNGWLPNYGCQEYKLKEGDEIEWYFGAYGFETWYTKISLNKTKVKPGEEVTITLEGEITDLSGSSGRGGVKTKGVNNADIYVNGKQFYLNGNEVKTDKNGKANIKFDKPGRYSISAERINGQGLHDIVRPVPIDIVVDGKPLEGNGIIKNPLYFEEYNIVIDKKSTETEIVNAVKNVVNKFQNQSKKVKVSKEKIDILSDTTDVLTIIELALNRVKISQAIEGIGDSYKRALKIFTKYTGVLTKKEDKENASTIITKDVLKVAEKLIDKMDNKEKILESTNYIIDSLGKVIKNIGEKNSKEIEQRIINLVQQTIDKISMVKFFKKDIKSEGNKVLVKIQDEDIEKGKQINKNKKAIEEKLNKNNIYTAKNIISKLIIDVPVLNKQETELIISKSTMSNVEQYKIEKIQIQTENGAFSITPNTVSTNENEIRIITKKNFNIFELNGLDEKGGLLDIKDPIEVSVPFKGKVKNKDKVTAVLIKEDGKKERIGGTYNSTTNTVKYVTNSFGKFTVEEVEKHFKDLKGHEWAKEAIESLVAKGIINGKTDTEFDPSANITRAEFAALTSRLLNCNEDLSKQIPFKDVVKNKWYYNSVAAVYENELIDGKSPTSFDPEGNITREEVVKIISKVLESNLYKKQDKSKINVFNDSKEISSWAQEPVAMALYNGVIRSKDGNSFKPKANTTRAEVAVMLYRLYQLIMPS